MNFLLKKIHEIFAKYNHEKNIFREIRWVNFEFSSRCNLKCKWCTLDHTKPAQFMEQKILEKALTDLVESSYFCMERIDLHNAGETLLHPELRKMLDIFKEKKEKLKVKGVRVISLLTNATLLCEQKTREILESGALDEIRFSVDGGTIQDFQEIRRGADFFQVQNNIVNFLALNHDQIKSGIICIVPPGRPLTTEWMGEEFKKLLGSVNHFELRYPHRWDGSAELNVPLDKNYWEAKENQTCKFLLHNLVVLPNGDVTVCCADLNSRGVIGNVRTTGMNRILFSKQRKTMIKKFLSGKRFQIDLCKGCTGYYE
ncbi:MAG: hypothetical protein A2031_01745 [Deltaproteobacteria bacterium RBG_19FT_COMBO_43_11]|nr:MAG: hypothetical protein A2W27_09755 [Deltaproteobacteria bacterium RBG_16_44_11]OGP91472.1 MAG: hypothetical protein A2031_01745 [Deltaproteobacteria bacterium RBG_19FT_COMBO_43_11]